MRDYNMILGGQFNLQISSMELQSLLEEIGSLFE